MAFANELDVRNEAFLENYEDAASGQILHCIEAAHDDVLETTTLQDGDSVSPRVVRAEALLALSHYFLKRAAMQSASMQAVRTTQLRVDDHERIRHWLALSEQLGQQAWSLLRPHWKSVSAIYLVCCEPKS